MLDLALPRPDNLRGEFGHLVTNDVFNIAERVKEIDPNLYIYHAGNMYAICEVCRDGVERLVFRTTNELDGRVIEKLQYLLHVPFEHRFNEAEKLEAKAEEERKQHEHEQLYETIGRPMLTDLERCGFIQRSTSYAKRGIRR